MWEISNSVQLLSFVRSVGFGVILSLAYDLLRAFRRNTNCSTMSIFFQDVIFSSVSAFFMFVLLLSLTNGELRGFIFLGSGIGFVVTKLTVSVIWLKVLNWLFSKIKLGFSLLFGTIYKGFDCLEKNMAVFLKKSGKTLKKLLKRQGGLLYTKNIRKV